MPWDIKEGKGCPAAKPFAVVRRTDGHVEGCHPDRDSAKKQQAALYASERNKIMTKIHERAQMSSGSINDLPDSAFAYIEPGGKKDADGKTVPRSLRHFPIHDEAHVRNALARAPQSPFGDKAMPKIRAAAKKFGIELAEQKSHELLPVYVARALDVPQEFRSGVSEADGLGLMTGYFSVFDQWYGVESRWEGEFIERADPSAFTRTIAEERGQMRVLFDHGFDPTVGNKVLGPIRDLRPDAQGAWYEVPLFDTSYNRDLLPGLKAGVYGASMRMKVLADDWNDRPERSNYNPRGLPERTILEASVAEFGAVTFPASPGATAGVRSTTDRYYDQLRSRDSSSYDAAVRAVEAVHPDFIGAPEARSPGRDERAARAAQPTTRQRLDDGALRLRGIL
jgi:HK97 family phage prohead protease